MKNITKLAFVLLFASVIPAFATNQVRNSGKSDGQIILELKDQVDKEWWNDWKLRGEWFGYGVATGAATTLAAVFYFKSRR